MAIKLYFTNQHWWVRPRTHHGNELVSIFTPAQIRLVCGFMRSLFSPLTLVFWRRVHMISLGQWWKKRIGWKLFCFQLGCSSFLFSVWVWDDLQWSNNEVVFKVTFKTNFTIIKKALIKMKEAVYTIDGLNTADGYLYSLLFLGSIIASDCTSPSRALTMRRQISMLPSWQWRGTRSKTFQLKLIRQHVLH